MTYFESEIPVVKFVFKDKEFEFNTITQFNARLRNHPECQNYGTYTFKIAGLNKDFLDYFKSDKILYIEFCHSVKDQNGSALTFVEALNKPDVEIEQTLYTNGEIGSFKFTIVSKEI